MPKSSTLNCVFCADKDRYEMSCPDCGSEDFRTEQYDFGMDPETGYRDSGVRAHCRCGFSAEIGDFQRRVKGACAECGRVTA